MDEEACWRWAFKRAYGRRPRGEELTRYQYWHAISRRDGFEASGPWECWPSRPIPVCDRDAIKPVEATAFSHDVKTDHEPNIDESVDQAENQMATGVGHQLSTEKLASSQPAEKPENESSGGRPCQLSTEKQAISKPEKKLKNQLSTGDGHS